MTTIPPWRDKRAVCSNLLDCTLALTKLGFRAGSDPKQNRSPSLAAAVLAKRGCFESRTGLPVTSAVAVLRLAKIKTYGKFPCPCSIKKLGLPEDMTGNDPENRLIGYARISTYGMWLARDM